MAGKTVTLHAEDWVGYFESIALHSDRWLASVALGWERANGDGTSSPRPLRTVAYDPHDDELEVAVGGEPARSPTLRYFVPSPRAITIEEFDHTRAVMVDDSRGLRTLIRLFGLPAKAATATPVHTGGSKGRIGSNLPDTVPTGGNQRARRD
jgi:hypothetical protein